MGKKLSVFCLPPAYSWQHPAWETVNIKLFTRAWKFSLSGGWGLTVIVCIKPTEDTHSAFQNGPKNKYIQALQFFPLWLQHPRAGFAGPWQLELLSFPTELLEFSDYNGMPLNSVTPLYPDRELAELHPKTPGNLKNIILGVKAQIWDSHLCRRPLWP